MKIFDATCAESIAKYVYDLFRIGLANPYLTFPNRLLLQQEDEYMDETKLQLQCERRSTDSKCSC